jgi:putative acetyltransferase
MEAMIEVFVLAINKTASKDYNQAQRKEWSATAKNHDRWEQAMNSQEFWVAEVEGRVVGFISLKNKNYLDFLYVHPDYARRGIAQALYDTLLASFFAELRRRTHARTSHSSELSSDVSHTARPFFEKQGFEVVRENRNERNGEVLVNFRMVLKM